MSILGSTSGAESGRVRAIVLLGATFFAGLVLLLFVYAWLWNDKVEAKDPALLVLGAFLTLMTTGISFYFSGRQAENVAGTVAASLASHPALVPPVAPVAPGTSGSTTTAATFTTTEAPPGRPGNV